MVKVPPLLHKRNVTDQKAWFKKNWSKDQDYPADFAHLQPGRGVASVAKAGKKVTVSAVVKQKRAELSRLAYGTGGEEGVAGKRDNTRGAGTVTSIDPKSLSKEMLDKYLKIAPNPSVAAAAAHRKRLHAMARRDAKRAAATDPVEEQHNLGGPHRDPEERVAIDKRQDDHRQKSKKGSDIDRKTLKVNEAHKVGDTVKVLAGPHKGELHTVIHVHGGGKYAVKPKTRSARSIKYRLGAAIAGEHELEEYPKKVIKEGWNDHISKVEVHYHSAKGFGVTIHTNDGKQHLETHSSRKSAKRKAGEYVNAAGLDGYHDMTEEMGTVATKVSADVAGTEEPKSPDIKGVNKKKGKKDAQDDTSQSEIGKAGGVREEILSEINQPVEKDHKKAEKVVDKYKGVVNKINVKPNRNIPTGAGTAQPMDSQHGENADAKL